ncbi:hypothetical protein PVAP13_5KG386163 [Panicum virgatum]|uniref:Leucine-rich repeat-containing N-terminal plant-type domain-containing protein n=1 Tax=Panicum virgatum TaxID=38727 RepID=A0A8T0SP58_PANVG|nr:hypothetical protein PVAP13_5KG386163 [Panicum virgatum]
MTARLLLRLQGAAAIVSFLLVTLSSSLVPARAAISSGRGRGRGCVPSERAALISFKGSFTGPAGRLSSWRGGDCCRWKGVRCDNRTGHVIELDLHGREDCQMLRGETMSSSITALHHLRYLDLSFIYFNHTRIPSFLGTLDNLRYRNLSSAHFAGDIPLQLGNLSQLQHLDLRYGSRLNALDLSWLPRLSSLRSLDMSYMDLVSVSDWVHKVNMLPNLKTLFLSNCGLSSTISTLSHSNLTHLEKVTTLKELRLSGCEWSGPLPNELGNMYSLEVLHLDLNQLSGIMPMALKNLCNLQELTLSFNDIKGDMLERLPECSWSNLSYLDISQNMLVGRVPFGMGNMRSLSYLDLSQNRLVGSLPSGIGSMRNLSYLDLSQNMLTDDVPRGLGALSNLTYFSLGLNNFSDVLSKDLFAGLVNLEYLNLSLNSLKLDFSEDWVPPFRLTEGHFGSCDMGPRFPARLRWQTGIRNLDISNTRINDVLPHWFWVVVSNASSLDLSRNQLSGGLPAKLDLPFIIEMDLSRNSVTGKLPANFTAPYLMSLLLYSNNFTGAIPTYVCHNFFEINLSNNQLTGDSPQCEGNFSLLQMVDLKSNNLSGEFPRFAQNAAYLSFLDLSHNKFFGVVPTWIADKMPNLEVLILRSNMFHGHLPKQLAKLAELHYLDVAHNNISGNIPSSLARLRAMTKASDDNGGYNYSSDSITTFIKDRELNYTHESTKHIVLIDMSSNSFTGYIPKKLSLLKGLRSMNLSNHQISGPIPDGIAVLRELESLDLSYNYLSGKIPSSLSDLSFLSCLNSSYNDLSGIIPSGQQLQTLNNLYIQEHEGGRSSLYLSISTGFVMGLWTVFCAMLFMKTWRIAYFQLLDQLYDKIYVQVAISKAAFLRKRGEEEA